MEVAFLRRRDFPNLAESMGIISAAERARRIERVRGLPPSEHRNDYLDRIMAYTPAILQAWPRRAARGFFLRLSLILRGMVRSLRGFAKMW